MLIILPNPNKLSISKLIQLKNILLIFLLFVLSTYGNTFNTLPENQKKSYLQKEVKLQTGNGDTLSAQKAKINQETIHLLENIQFIDRNKSIFLFADEALYSKKTEQINFLNPICILPNNLFLQNQKIVRSIISNQSNYLIPDAQIFLEEKQSKGLHLRIKETKIQNDSILFKQPTFYYSNIPILPFFIATKHKNEPLRLPELGYQSHLGAYWKNRLTLPPKNKSASQSKKIEWQSDLFSKRGLGIGWGIKEERENSTFSSHLYYINDIAPETKHREQTREKINEDRYRFKFKHSTKTNSKGWQSHIQADIISDKFFLRDFAEEEFEKNPAPDNFFLLKNKTESIITSIFSRFHINTFQTTDQRLPEINIDMPWKNINNSPLLHTFSISLGAYHEFSEKEEISTIRQNRIQGNYQISSPWNHRNFSFIPKVGAGYTSYNNLKETPSFETSYLFTGLDFQFKLYRLYPLLENNKYGIKGILHSIQPYFNFSHIDTKETPQSFKGIEKKIPSPEARILNPIIKQERDYHQDQSILRMGIKNTLTTQRNQYSYSWLYTNTYIDRLIEDSSDTDYSNLYQEIEWLPVPWISAQFSGQFPILKNSPRKKDIQAGIKLMPIENIEFLFQYQKNKNFQEISDRHSFDMQTYIAINESYGFQMKQNWNRENNDLEYQEYSIHKNNGIWLFGINLYQRREENEKKETGISFRFSLGRF